MSRHTTVRTLRYTCLQKKDVIPVPRHWNLTLNKWPHLDPSVKHWDDRREDWNESGAGTATEEF
ncbi:UNVERIFIED_CONTAM: hypothetical protein LBW93_00135 [Wolbachia endosymbiont of Nasonia longicornis]